MAGVLASDLDEVLTLTQGLWEPLRGARMLVTGGTGFMGCWLMESLLLANRRFALGIEVVALTRRPDVFAAKAPHLAQDPALRLVQGNVLRWPAVEGCFSHLIHGATDASGALLEANPALMFDTIVEGTRNTLELAHSRGVSRTLFLGSGAVYGRQPAAVERVKESYLGGPDCTDPLAAYAEGKRAAETLCGIYTCQHGLPVVVARCFAFHGPHLPLDLHFAIGNFLRDVLADSPIVVKGDGTPRRSYLYATDLVTWLWHLLVRGEGGRAYNVGSEADLSIAELADIVNRTLCGKGVRVLGTPDPSREPERYVPSTQRIREELGLVPTVSLEEGLQRTAAWHRR
ncbi:MAG: NAD-dependent epimerase/dehydratase family protein [Firmicutes bacterium]|nr:NAD-dependent epimerase/dehydratase family protein [Bacillota bacterium]